MYSKSVPTYQKHSPHHLYRVRYTLVLGERLNGIQEVSGSIPLISTKTAGNEGKALVSGGFCFAFPAGFRRCGCFLL